MVLCFCFADKSTTSAEASLLTKILRTKLINNSNDVEVQRKDPNSPLYSVKTFEELRLWVTQYIVLSCWLHILSCSRPELLKGVYGMGFNSPSKIQERALPMLMASPPTNFIAQSQSGTGKTAAFVLAMLSRVDTSKRHPQVIHWAVFIQWIPIAFCLKIICLSPTFDLAKQTGNVLVQMAQYCADLKMVYALRGERGK